MPLSRGDVLKMTDGMPDAEARTWITSHIKDLEPELRDELITFFFEEGLKKVSDKAKVQLEALKTIRGVLERR